MIISPISTVRIEKQLQRTASTTLGQVANETLRDNISFSPLAKGMLIPNEENVFRKIQKGLFNEEILIQKGKAIGCIKNFSVRSQSLYSNLADGVFITDRNGGIQNFVFQHHLNGSSFEIGKIDVFDMAGNLVKTLTPQQAKILRYYRGNLTVNINSVLIHGNIENSLLQRI